MYSDWERRNQICFSYFLFDDWVWPWRPLGFSASSIAYSLTDKNQLRSSGISTQRASIVLELRTMIITCSRVSESFSSKSFLSKYPEKHGPAAYVIPVLQPLTPSQIGSSILVSGSRLLPNNLFVLVHLYRVNFVSLDHLALVSSFWTATTFLNRGIYIQAWVSLAISFTVD